jgi:hypothetical protein
MRLSVLTQTAKGLPEKIGEGEERYELRSEVLKDLERIKWYLWHGNVFQAINALQDLEMELDAAVFETKDENAQKLLKGVEDLQTYTSSETRRSYRITGNAIATGKRSLRGSSSRRSIKW